MPITIAAMAVEPLQNGAGVADPTTIEWTRTALLGILGYGLLAGVGALALAFGYRAVTVRQLPIGPAVHVGLALPAGWLTGEALRRGSVIADSPLVHYATGSYVLGVLVAGTVVAAAGHRLGDHLARGTCEITTVDASGSVTDLVQSAGLAVTVTLPESIDDADGYPVVDDAIKRDLADRDVLFPSGLSTSALRSRLERRLESDYDLGYVRADLAADGGVGALTIGARRAGIGPTLGPDRVAVAIAGDPSSRASVGDPVEVWTDDGSSRLVTTGTFRASAETVTTLIVDADDAEAFEPGDRYRLTTRPETSSDAHALVSAIRTADETVTATTVAADGPLESEFAGWVSGTVLAIDRDGDELSLPADNEPLDVGDTIYVFGPPVELADLDGGTEPSAGSEPPESAPEAAD